MGALSLLLQFLPQIIKIAPQVTQIIQNGAPIIAAWQKAAPDVVPLIKNLASTIFGDAGGLENAIVGALLSGHPLTPEQQKRWDDHMAGVDPITGQGPSGG